MQPGGDDRVQVPGPGQLGAIVHEPGPVQVTSHSQESEQSTPIAQLAVTVQPTVHGPVPQVMAPPQALLALQTTSQLVASLQSIPPPHDGLPPHSTLHL